MSLIAVLQLLQLSTLKKIKKFKKALDLTAITLLGRVLLKTNKQLRTVDKK